MNKTQFWLGFLLFTVPLWVGAGEDDYLETAKKAAHWLRAQAVETPQGRTWPPDPQQPERLSTALYHGSSGVVLFFLEMYRATGDESYLNDALQGGQYLQATLPEALTSPTQAGLYTGVGGVGFVLTELSRVSKDPVFRQGALRCVDLTLAVMAENPGEVTDIVSGHAGIGLYLLDAAQRLDRPDALAMAEKLGKDLIAGAVHKPAGWSWPMTPDFPRVMPNFSHGTAGAAFFLSRLHEATNNKDYLNAALQGGNLLLALAREDGLIYHNQPRDPDLYYLGWCHGPTGTTRLYEQLWRLTKKAVWREAAIKAMTAVRKLDIHQKRTPGFWNNVGICCGSAGVCMRAADFSRMTDDAAFQQFASLVAEDIKARATAENQGFKWIHAENRVQPDMVKAQTGYMQGAAGIGIAFLHLHYRQKDASSTLRLPDQVPNKTN